MKIFLAILLHPKMIFYYIIGAILYSIAYWGCIVELDKTYYFKDGCWHGFNLMPNVIMSLFSDRLCDAVTYEGYYNLGRGVGFFLAIVVGTLLDFLFNLFFND